MNNSMRQAFSAIVARDANRLDQILNTIPNINEGTGEHTLLHAAAENGNVQMIETLIKHNAHPDVVDKNGMTPIEVAIERNNYDVFRSLQHSGANLEIADKSGARALHWAAQTGNEKITADLLQARVDPSPLAKFDSAPIHLAVRSGSVAVLKLLIQYNAPLESATKQQTALYIASLKGNVEVMTELIKAGANLEAKNNRNWTPLHVAASSGRLEAVKLLIDSKANVGASDVEGHTPAGLARAKGHEEIASLLEKDSPSSSSNGLQDFTSFKPTIQKAVICIYPFTKAIFGEQHKPGDLVIATNDIITNVVKSDSGWWEGTVNGTKGTFPHNYVTGDFISKGKVLHTYYAGRLDEMNIKKGEEVDIYEKRPSGWLRVISNGRAGLVPPTHVREMKPIVLTSPRTTTSPVATTNHAINNSINIPSVSNNSPSNRFNIPSASANVPVSTSPGGSRVGVTPPLVKPGTLRGVPVGFPSAAVQGAPLSSHLPPPPSTTGPPPMPATTGPPPLPIGVAPLPAPIATGAALKKPPVVVTGATAGVAGRGAGYGSLRGSSSPSLAKKVPSHSMFEEEDSLLSTSSVNPPRAITPQKRAPPVVATPAPQLVIPALPRAKVLYPYAAQHPGDLELTVGTTIELTKTEGGWWEGTFNGNKGIFPANYVERL